MRRLNKKYWPIRVEFSDVNLQEKVKWSKEKMPGRVVLAGLNIWYFKDERDVLMFKLRWSDYS